MNADQARNAMLDYDAYYNAVNGKVNDMFYYYREQAALKASLVPACAGRYGEGHRIESGGFDLPCRTGSGESSRGTLRGGPGAA